MPRDASGVKDTLGNTFAVSKTWTFTVVNYATLSKSQQATGVNTRSFEVKFHSRIALCFIPLVMCWLGIPFSIGNRRSGGIGRDLSLALLVTFFYWLFYSISLSLGVNGALHPWLAAWLPTLIFTAVLVVLAGRRTA